jgi:hypothetical protein
MVALVEVNVLRVLGPGLLVQPPGWDNGFAATSAVIPGPDVVAGSLVEARIPGFDLRRTTDALLSGLRDRGKCVPYRIPDTRHGAYETGGLSVTRRPYRVVDAAGHAHPRRFAYGIPTESVHWITAAGIRPGVNSVILADADAIAQACLVPEPAISPPASSGSTPVSLKGGR